MRTALSSGRVVTGSCWEWERSPDRWLYPWNHYACTQHTDPSNDALAGLWHHLAHAWDAWQYTPGWGSLGTIAVATLAIIFSARYNRRTLALSMQLRADSRSDVLRKEVATLLTLVSQVEQAYIELFRRVRNIPVDQNGITRSPNEIRARLSGLAVRELLAEPLTAYDTHESQIRMLDSDETVLTNIYFITEAVKAKGQLLIDLIGELHRNANMTPTQQQQQQPHANFLAISDAWARDHNLTLQIRASRGHLTRHVTSRLNPEAVEAVERMLRQWPNVSQRLGPSSVIIFRPQPTPPPPPQPQPQPQPQPDDAPTSPLPPQPPPGSSAGGGE